MIKKNKRINLFPNKKGSIIGDIGNFINGIVTVIPPQVKFILFLLIIVAFSYLLTIIFNAFGVYCNSANVPVKLNVNIMSSIDLMGKTPDIKDINSESINPTNNNIVSECVVDLSPELFETGGAGGKIKYANGTIENITGEKFFYQNTRCVDCRVVVQIKGLNNAFWGWSTDYCMDDVYRKPDSEKSWLAKTTCDSDSMLGSPCTPPPHYMWSHVTGKYQCMDNTCEGMTVGKAWDETLARNGAKLLNPDVSQGMDISSKGFVGLTCTDMSPRLAVYGIDLFSFTVWVFLTLIILLFWAWKHFT
jgi:hypothetical protein